MPPKLDKDALTGRINVTAPKSLIQRLEKWRASHQPVLTNAEAVRILVSEALDARMERGATASDAAKQHGITKS